MKGRVWSAGLAATLALLLAQVAVASGASLRFDEPTLSGVPIESCWNRAGPDATFKWVPYSSFLRDGTVDQLYLDVYVPPSRVHGPYPAVVMVHGGSWAGGCRRWNNAMSVYMARRGFMVFNVDYRVACNTKSVYLCGFHFPAPVDDVKAAIAWVRGNAGTYGNFTGKVVAVGTSAGGNLVYMAGDTATGDSKPDVMAGGSGHPEMGYLSPEQGVTNSSCAESDDPLYCVLYSKWYLGYTLDILGDWCGDGGGDNWSPASPACNIDPSNLPPPTFIANATFELSAYRAATDFADLLRASAVPFQLCTVGGGPSDPEAHLHGTELFVPTVTCNETGTVVFEEMIGFIRANLPP